MAYIYHKLNHTVLNTNDENIISLAKNDPHAFEVSEKKMIKDIKADTKEKHCDMLDYATLKKMAEEKSIDCSSLTMKELEYVLNHK